MNGTRHGQQPSTTSISDSLTLHDLSGEDTVDDHDEGDYSARLEELLKDDEGEHKSADGAQDEDDEEGFFYTGVDSQPSGTYREQLRDVLGPENEDDEQEEEEVKDSERDRGHPPQAGWRLFSRMRFCRGQGLGPTDRVCVVE